MCIFACITNSVNADITIGINNSFPCVIIIFIIHGYIGVRAIGSHNYKLVII